MLFGREHTQRYKETNGEVGHDWQGTQTLLLTTTGSQVGRAAQAAADAAATPATTC